MNTRKSAAVTAVGGTGAVGRGGRGGRRAFTLIELMVVVIIVVVVIAIVIPALGGARVGARNASTLGLLNQLNTASESFRRDTGRVPGYFSQQEMGSNENGTVGGGQGRGLSQMENIVLDLSGGIVDAAGGQGIGGGNTNPEVGPTRNNTVRVNPQLIGINSNETQGQGGYWSPDTKVFVAQSAESQAASVGGHIALQDVVDYFGNPLLAWVEDDVPGYNAAFARANYVEDEARARFYWASNAAFLKSKSLGRGGKSQVKVDVDTPHSLLGEGMSEEDVSATLAALLGDPSTPNPADLPATLPAPGSISPTAARGALVFHSAGADGLYLGSEDRGGKYAYTNDNGRLYYSRYFYDFTTTGGRRVEPGPDGADLGITDNLLKHFDDLVQTAGK